MQDFRFKNGETLAAQLAQDFAERMRKTITKQGKVTIALSGGRTPVQFFQQLSQQPIAWDRVIVTLVDERWVDSSDEASNEYLIRQHLLQNEASNAWLVPLKTKTLSAEEGYMECENRLYEQAPQLDYAVLGMGNDGHCASWFPHSNALTKALDSQGTAKCVPVLDAPEFERMTLTWSYLAQCRHLFLHFEGDEKNQTWQQVIASEQLHDLHAMPVRHLLNQQQVPLSIYRTF